MNEWEEQIPDGGGPPEDDVSGNQGEARWAEELNSDAGLTPEAKRRLGLEGRPRTMVDLAALGAFLSGAASVIGAAWAIRRVRKRDDEECEKRLEAFREGLKFGKGD